MTLSRDAVEVLIGAAWPNARGVEHDVILETSNRGGRLQASSPDVRGRATHRLPLEQILTWDVGGESITMKNRVIRIGTETAPPDFVAIPPGATLVEADFIHANRLLDEWDRLPSGEPRN